MPRSLGHFSMSATAGEVIGLDLGPDLRGSSFVGNPTVTGENCTATYLSHTAAGMVSVRVTSGTYAGAVVVTAPLADGRTAVGQADVRFIH